MLYIQVTVVCLQVLAGLIKCVTTIKDVKPKYTESRVDAIKAIIRY